MALPFLSEQNLATKTAVVFFPNNFLCEDLKIGMQKSMVWR